VNEPSEENRAAQYTLSQLRAPSLARCRTSFRRSVSHPRPTAADSVVRWTVVRRRPRGALAAQPITPGGPNGCASSTLGEDRDHTAGCPGSGMLRGQTFGDGTSCGTWSLSRPDAVGCPLGAPGRGPLLRRPRVGPSRRAAGRIYPAASITSAVHRRRSQFWAAAERMDTSGEDQPT
jgi:hypothetical protein